METIGQAPEPETGSMWVSVGDRGSDVFSYLRRARRLNWHCLLRICQDRVIQTPDGIKGRLKSFARSLKPIGSKTIILRGRDGEPLRTVELQIGWSQVQIYPPQRGPERKQDPVSGWCIRCSSATNQSDNLEWILFTTVPIIDLESALQLVDWYATRWLIEEYHKCLKTGCAVEKRQLKTASRLQRLLGFIAIVALRLIQLRTHSRSHPDAPAREVVPSQMLQVLVARLNLPSSELTLKEFWRGLARLGGFIGRNGDGVPGWQTLWRGWMRLHDMCWGAALVTGTG